MGSGAEIGELERLYRERFEDFVRIARSITGDDAAASDAVQEAFARAIRSRRSFRGESALDGWVWGIVLNVARSNRTVVTLELPNDEQTTNTPADFEAFGFRHWVMELPERQRLMVFLRYWADLDYRSIAEAVDVEIGTVSATLNAAHTALRRSFREVS
jgi:RNA polymerase sigma factor (sigma-70 family)